jgi:hypothetical protein
MVETVAHINYPQFSSCRVTSDNQDCSFSKIFAKRQTAASDWMLCSREMIVFFILTAVRMKTDVFLFVTTSVLAVFPYASEETSTSIFIARPAEGGCNFLRNTDKQSVTLQKAAVLLL